MKNSYSEAREQAISTDRSIQLQQSMQDTNPYVVLATIADMFNNEDYVRRWNWSEDTALKVREEIAQLYVKVGKAEGAV